MSADEHLRILDMVAQGTISADEAEQLFAALDTDSPAPIPTPAHPTPEPEVSDAVIPPAKKKKRKRGLSDAPPDMDRFRRYWEYPFLAGLILLGVAGMCASNTPNGLVAFCGWSVVLLGGLLALIGWVSQWSPWVHIRIHEQNGTRIALSLPLPVQLFSGLLRVVSKLIVRRVDRDTAENIEMAASFLALLEEYPIDDPITVDVLDDDGDQVQVYIG